MIKNTCLHSQKHANECELSDNLFLSVFFLFFFFASADS